MYDHREGRRVSQQLLQGRQAGRIPGYWPHGQGVLQTQENVSAERGGPFLSAIRRFAKCSLLIFHLYPRSSYFLINFGISKS